MAAIAPDSPFESAYGSADQLSDVLVPEATVLWVSTALARVLDVG